MSLRIIPYDSRYETEAGKLMAEVNAEFNMPASHPTYKPKVPDNYWLAFDGDLLIGMVALNIIDDYGILKRMFVKAPYRGSGIAYTLLQTLIDCAETNNLSAVYLGTIDTFKAAQQFYSKHAFKQILHAELPDTFEHNPIDTLFYKRIL